MKFYLLALFACLGLLAPACVPPTASVPACEDCTPAEDTATSDENDNDGDGYSVSAGEDCNDQDEDVNPEADEECDEKDNDCDGEIDEGEDCDDDDEDLEEYDSDDDDEDDEIDSDGDGWPVGEDDDCNDQNDDVNPEADEECNGIDDDCDGEIDEGVTTRVYRDRDGDDWGDELSGTDTCGVPSGYADQSGDCDDEDASVYPGAPETCDGVDDDCDGKKDEDFDKDGDGYTTCAGDCDDTDALVYTGSPERCDNKDNDCDGSWDEGNACGSGTDSDGDGWPVGENNDCNDANSSVYPGAPEKCNGVDDDCDGKKDEDFDKDGDGYTTCGTTSTTADCDDTLATVYPGATEIADGKDNDCDGSIDEGTTTTDPWADYVKASGISICLSTKGIQSQYQSSGVFFVGNMTTWSAESKYHVSPSSGYYCLSTAGWAFQVYDITAISDISTTGGTTTSYANTADWWDNYAFCSSGSTTAKMWCTVAGTDAQGNKTYLIRFQVTSDGVKPAGNLSSSRSVQQQLTPQEVVEAMAWDALRSRCSIIELTPVEMVEAVAWDDQLFRCSR